MSERFWLLMMDVAKLLRLPDWVFFECSARAYIAGGHANGPDEDGA